MRKVNVVILAAALAVANVASANPSSDCPGNSCHGGDASVGNVTATGVGVGGGADVDVRTSVDTDVRNSATSGSFSGASSNQKQGQLQGQQQGQENYQGISAFNGNTTTVEAPDVKAMGRELAKHAASAAEVRSDSKADASPCGDSTGLSAQAGVLGGGFATVSESCRAFRLQVLEAVGHKNADGSQAPSTTLAEISYYVGWFPRLVLHVASFGVLN